MAIVGVMDSGAGGLSVLRELRKEIPEARYLYFSDAAWCPYGDKSAEFIRERCRVIVSRFVEQGADAVVIACNTATAAAIADLRAGFDIPFVGMEPAVKPAALGTRSGVVGVLATAGTLAASKYIDTRDKYSAGVRIIEHVGRGFVELVESGELDGPNAEKVVRMSLDPLLEAGADTIVLGCTHYPFLLPVLQRLAGPSVTFIDPAPAVARQLRHVLSEVERTASEPSVSLESSGDPAILKEIFEKYC